MRIGPSFIKLGKAILYPLEVSLAAPRVAGVPHRHGSGTALLADGSAEFFYSIKKEGSGAFELYDGGGTGGAGAKRP